MAGWGCTMRDDISRLRPIFYVAFILVGFAAVVVPPLYVLLRTP